MHRRSSFGTPATINVQGVLGTFKVPHADLTVEYVLTYASLDGGNTANGQLLDLLVPVREVFHLEDLDFDHLLQRDLDDFRVSEEMVPYLLGQTSSDPRFFPPIVAVIVPMSGANMEELYPQCKQDSENDGDILLRVFNYGNVFSVKREKGKDGQLAQSPVDICIHPTQAKLAIVDGQHRAMAMLAAYRSASNKWSGNEFKHFYKEVNLDISELRHIHLPVCIAYFPELTQGSSTTTMSNLTKACRKFFLDVNRNARHPSEARQILLDDTDLVACFTRHLFNMVKKNTKTGTLRLYHTEYDNPHNRVPIFRPFALTDVYTLFSTVRSVLLTSDRSVRNPMAPPSSGKPQNNQRLQRELELENVLTENDKEQLDIKITNIKQNAYPRSAEEKLRQCFEETWGQVIVNSLNKLYPFSIHIEAVDTILKNHAPYTGVNQIAHTALVQGQGLRHTLNQQQQRDKELRQDGKESDAEKAWKSLRSIEEDFEKYRAKLYLKLTREPDPEEISMVKRLFECFRSNAFQNGLFMTFACLKDRISIEDPSEFLQFVDRWIQRVNRKFGKSKGVRDVLFDYSNPKSLRCIYKPRGGLTPSDWVFFRYLILELLSVKSGKECAIINPAKAGWRAELYKTLYDRKERELRSANEDEDEDEDINSQDHLDLMSFREIVDAFESSLDISEEEIKLDLSQTRGRTPQSALKIKDGEENYEMEDTNSLHGSS